MHKIMSNNFKKAIEQYAKTQGIIKVSDKICYIDFYVSDDDTVYISFIEKITILDINERLTVAQIKKHYIIRSINDFRYYKYFLTNVDIGVFRNIAEGILFPEENKDVILWPSNKIKYAYLEANYSRKEKGDLGHSCMRSKNMQKALNFYEKNGVKIAVLLDNKKKILARALVWENVIIDKSKIPITYIDRVYYSSSQQQEYFMIFAKKNKFITYRGLKKQMTIKKITVKNITHLPYTDTFRYLYPKKGILTNSYGASGYLKLSHLGENYGYFRELDPSSVQEALSNNYISKKDAIFIKRYGGYVAVNNVVNIKNSYYSKRDNKNIGLISNGNYVLKKNIVNELYSNNKIDKTNALKVGEGYIDNDNVIIIHNKKYSVYENSIIKWEGTYYHTSQCYYIQDDNKWCPKTKICIVYSLTEDIVLVKNPNHSGVGYLSISELSLPEYSEFENKGIIKEGGDFNKKHYILSENTHKYRILATGEAVLSSEKDKLVYYNKKYYLKKYFVPRNKNQMLLPFKK